MKKNLSIIFALYLMTSAMAMAQHFSPFRVEYMVTYDKPKDLFTAWVVPQYNTPNYHNGGNEERGATAQFTIKTPKGFVISQIQDLKGNWDKKPTKIDTKSSGFLNSSRFKNESKTKDIAETEQPNEAYSYYILGKAPVETNYGQFLENEPVALFHFKGTGANPLEVTALESTDPFIKMADETMALNIGNSFYSRSGQLPKMNTTPLEQFAAPVALPLVLDRSARKAGIALDNISDTPTVEQMVAYPNPAQSTITVKYFSQQDGGRLTLDVVDLKGEILLNQQSTTKLGFNTIRLDISKLKTGAYVVKTLQGNSRATTKFIKTSE